MTRPFTPTTQLARMWAEGHRRRHGHTLVGYYAPTDAEWVVRLVRTCCIPADWPVQPITPDAPATDPVTCGECGRTWDDAVSTSMTPAPSARCPFEPFH